VWIREKLRELVHHDSLLWRRALAAGVTYGPDFWVRYSPPVFGLAFSAALPRQRAVVRRTLRKALGPRPAWQELCDVARVFMNFAGSMTDAMLVGSQRGYTAQSKPVGRQHLAEALAQGRGVIAATAHTAGWDAGAGILRNVYPAEVLVVMEPEAASAARELHDARRERTGVRIVHVGPDPLASLPLLHHLRRGHGVVAMKFARLYPRMRSRAVRFFGAPWRIAEGPLSLAALTGAPIVPVFTRRLGFLEYECMAAPAITLAPKPTEQALNGAAQQLASALEAFVQRHPTSWFRFSES